MKKAVKYMTLVLAALVLIYILYVAAGFVIGSINQPYLRLPGEGLWYCEELDTAIDCRTYGEYFLIQNYSSETEAFVLNADYGGRLFIDGGTGDSWTHERYGSVMLDRKDPNVINVTVEGLRGKYKFIRIE